MADGNANDLLTIYDITQEALRLAHEKATFIKTVCTDYDDQFAKTGGKIGDTLRIREPIAYSRRKGSRVMAPQDSKEKSQLLTVATQDGVDMKFNGAEMSLKLDNFSQRHLEPAMNVLISGIEGEFLQAMTQQTYNVVGTPGTVVGAVTAGFSDTTALGLARAKLNQGLAPKDNQRAVQMDSITMASVTNGIKNLFIPDQEIRRAWVDGFIGHTQMADFYENERTWAMTNSADVLGSTDGAALVTDGGNIIDMHTLIPVASQVVGEVFTIAGVYACHPQTKQAYAHLQQFVITAIGATTTTISPPTILTGPYQNVCASNGAVLLTTDFNAKVVTPWGAASATYRQNLMYHRDAYCFVTADLPIMDNELKCVRMQKDGIAVRVWQGPDIRADELLTRIDILYGWLAIRPAWGCRISN